MAKRKVAAPARDRLGPADREQLVLVAHEFLEKIYVHLPLKRAMYAVNPLQRLRLLRRRLGQGAALSDREFLSELLSVFAELRDLHTNFVLPEPFQSTTAYLPFRLQRCAGLEGAEQYVVSHVMPEAARSHEQFRPGAVVSHWNGVPIQLAVAANADREAGSNPAARFAQGLNALTIRWLGQSPMPDEDWIDVSFAPPGSRPADTPQVARFHWAFFRREGRGRSAVARASRENALAVGLDERGEAERQMRKHLFSALAANPTQKVYAVRAEGWAKDVFPLCASVSTAHGEFAYVRLATFNVDEEQPYLDEFIRIVRDLPQDGLILDVRGNGGGLIHFGERMLQLLTPHSIEPARFSFLNSARTLDLARQHASLRPWLASIEQAVETGAEYSQGLPLLPVEKYNDLGQKYQGPVVLITDALCYSTTDIFAAGFQDHGLGPILGVDENTGAGGANVWTYELLAELLQDKSFKATLPRAASFRFAVRRVTRVAANSGAPLEDLGVRPDRIHQLTLRDILERNADLIEKAGELLAQLPKQQLVPQINAAGKLTLRFRNLDRIDLYADQHPLASLPVALSAKSAQRVVDVKRHLARGQKPRELQLAGFRGEKLVAAARQAW